jgi:hypothetical protein
MDFIIEEKLSYLSNIKWDEMFFKVKETAGSNFF